ncbi:MAG: HI0074 family nucleotidyltransferase substrate-binding subunit [Nitrospinota bacterium]
MSKLEAVLNQFQTALTRLDEVLRQEKNEFMRDAAIKRFEFTFDLSWKLIKACLEELSGIICASPKACIREAYKQSLIEYDDRWLEMTDDRNRTAHLYRVEMADEIYGKLDAYSQLFHTLLDSIKNKTR